MIHTWRLNDHDGSAPFALRRLDAAQTIPPLAGVSNAAVHAARLRAGDSPTHALERDRMAWLVVVSGHVFACGAELHGGSVAQIEDEPLIALYAESESLLLLLDSPRPAIRRTTP